MNHYDQIKKRESQQVEKVYDITEAEELPKAQTILLLEDDMALAQSLQEGLHARGYVVTTVSNGADGLKQILFNNYDAIVCDMVMPNFPGDMFFLAVERSRPALCRRFIFISGHQGDRKIDQFIRNVHGLVLWKPFPLDVLLEAIRTVTAKKL